MVYVGGAEVVDELMELLDWTITGLFVDDPGLWAILPGAVTKSSTRSAIKLLRSLVGRTPRSLASLHLTSRDV